MITTVKKITRTVVLPCPECEGTGKVYRHYAVPDWGGLREWEEEFPCPRCNGTGYYSIKVTAPETFWKLIEKAKESKNKVVVAIAEAEIEPIEF